MMEPMFKNYSKELIKNRLLRNAAKLWGVHNFNALDPFVVLLIDALSTEIFKVNNEIEEVKSRILEKTARLLTPSIYTYARPAYAIASMLPEDSREVLLNHTEFFIKKQFTSSIKSASDVQIDIPFTPIDDVNLVKAHSSLLLVNNTVYSCDEYNNKTAVARLDQKLAHNKIVLGLDFSSYDEELFPTNLSLFCSNTAYENLEFVYKLLPFIKIKHNNKLLGVEAGLTYAEGNSTTGYEEIFEKYEIRTRIQEDIKKTYENQFIEIQGFSKSLVLERGSFPEVLSFANQRKDLARLVENKAILWLEIDFPPQYTEDIIENFNFIMNAFPVYNRAWKRNECSLDVMGNNIPLVTQLGEYFLYVDKIIDSSGRNYSEIPFAQNDNLGKGLFTVRRGGMERFSERNALDMITNLLELTRDEVSAFGVFERDKVVEALRNMTQQMKTLDQKVKTVRSNIASQVNYVIVEPFGNIEHMSASFWVTHCSLANHIRNGTFLVQQNKTYANKNRTIQLLTTTKGGEEEQKGTDAIQAYKYALTTRDKIISSEDIKSFCRMMLKEQCIDIRVFKGTIVSDKPKEGFIRTININIRVFNYNDFSENYWKANAQSLKKQIISKAIDGIEYIVQFLPEEELE